MSKENNNHLRKLNTQQAELITKEFGRFLYERQPIIKDAGLLPYPKDVIMKAIIMQQKSIQDYVNMSETFLQPDERKHLKQYFDSIGFCRVGLAAYSDIDPEDKETVSYFNSFRTISDVPEDRKVECVKFIRKYTSH